MKYKQLTGRKVFDVLNSIFLLSVSVICLLPFVYILAVSLSSSNAVSAGIVNFLPVDFTFSSYIFVMKSKAFITSFGISLQRILFGVLLNMILIVLSAYPLSKDKEKFRHRKLYVWFFIITMLFSGGLIPTYMIIRMTGLIDKIGALVIPTAVPIFSVIVMLNFFRNLPKELEESAYVDGASHWRILLKIYIPLSKPSLATVALFSMIFHWNSWFDGLIYMNRPENYPLQSYLQTVIINPEAFFKTISSNPDVSTILAYVNNQTTKASQLFISMIPILLVYPLLQKYFTTGLVLGSVKG